MKVVCRLSILSLILLSASFASAQEAAKKSEAKTPTEVIKLFNGKDFTGLYTYLADTKYEDPRKVFTVTDGMVHISGDGFGYITTKEEYQNYHLKCEFKWGPRTWRTRADRTKDSGILVHCVGPDGNNGNWMASIEYQVIQGGVGDFIVVGGKYADGSAVPVSLTAETAKDRDGETIWHKGGERKVFPRGRINWYGRDPDWKDVLNFRGKDDVESPDGEWTTCEIICDGGTITNIVNGKVVNQGFDAFPSAGKIIFQTEGAEIFYRNIELHPLKK